MKGLRRVDPHPVIETTMDNGDYVGVLLNSYYATIDGGGVYLTLRVQVPNNCILPQNLYYNSYYPNPKYLVIGYLTLRVTWKLLLLRGFDEGA